MSLLCATSKALDALAAKKKALSDAMAGSIESLKSSMGSALSGIGDALNAMKPESSSNFSLKEDLASLAGKVGGELALAKRALNERWGKMVDGLEGLMDRVANPDFSICDEVPNIEAKPNPDGTLEKVAKAQPTPAPSSGPEASTPVTEVPIDDSDADRKIIGDYNVYAAAREDSYRSIRAAWRTLTEKVIQLKDTEAVRKAEGRVSNSLSNDDFGARQVPEERLRKGLITQAEYAAWQEYRVIADSAVAHVAFFNDIINSFEAWEFCRAGIGNGMPEFLRLSDAEYAAKHQQFPSQFSNPEKITDQYSDAIRAYLNRERSG